MPTDDEPGVDVYHQIAIEVLTLHRTCQFRDVPSRYLPRRGGHQLRDSPGRMLGQSPAFLHLPVFFQHPVERGDRTQVDPFIQQLRIDL